MLPERSNCGPIATETSISRWSFPTARGSIAARVWNANETLYKSFDNGDYVHVVGTAQLYQGAMQIIAAKLRKVEPSEVDESEFTPLPPVAVDKLMVRLGEILSGLSRSRACGT